MMTIKAKYAGKCSNCHAHIPAGTEVEWDKATRSIRHLKCRATAQPLLNSPGVPQTAGVGILSDEEAQAILAREGRQFARPLPDGKPTLTCGSKVMVEGKELSIGSAGDYAGIATDWPDPTAERRTEAKRYGISLIDGSVLPFSGTISDLERQMGAPIGLERDGKNSVKLGEIFRSKGLRYLVTEVSKSYYLSEEDAEDRDMFNRGGGWATPYRAREVTLSRAERDKDAVAAQAKAEAAQKKQKQAEHFRALRTAPEGWTAIDGALLDSEVALTSLESGSTEKFAERALPVPEKEQWQKLDEEHETDGTKAYAILYQAGPYRVLEHGDFDDWRVMVMVPPDLVAGYLGAIVAEYVAEYKITKADAEAWLAEYRGCVGTQIYEWAAAHLEG